MNIQISSEKEDFMSSIFTIVDFLEYIVHYYIENDLHHYKLDIDLYFHPNYLHNHSFHYNVRYLEYIYTNLDNELDHHDKVDYLYKAKIYFLNIRKEKEIFTTKISIFITWISTIII
jgi:hypothetical protein